MIDALKTIALRFALCSAATWLVWWTGLNSGIVFMAGLYGVMLARPLLDLAIAIPARAASRPRGRTCRVATSPFAATPCTSSRTPTGSAGFA